MVKFALKSFAQGISKMSARMFQSQKMGKSLEKVKKMSVNSGIASAFAVDAACYKQVALANRRAGGNFCRVGLLHDRA